MRVLALSFLIAVLDQASKYIVLRRFMLGESITVIPAFFNLTYLRNTGAVWGIFQHQNEWLALLSLLVLIVIACCYRRLADDRSVHFIALACMMGGIAGNLIDRIKLGWVVDFLDFHLYGYHWPCFNIADAAICIGVILYIASSLRHGVYGAPTKETNAPAVTTTDANTQTQV